MSEGKLTRKANYMTPHQMERSLKTLELYLDGHRWAKIHALGGYSWREFSYMMAKYPDLGKSYQEARRSSGHSFEDKALWLAEELTAPNEFTGTQVQAHKAAMEQYRWSASRRNPTDYAEAGAKQVSVVVPIQINSSLNLAEPGAGEEIHEQSAYEVRETVLLDATESPEDESDGLEVESDGQVPEIAPSGLPVALEAIREQVKLPLEVPAAIKKRPSPGRRPLRHKSAMSTGVTRGTYAKMKKSPSVMRALGLTETVNEPTVDARTEPAEPRDELGTGK